MSKAETITVDDLVDTSGVAELLGIAPESVTRYRARDESFPAPLRHFGGAPVWTRDVVLAWAESRPGRGAGGGRPRKSRHLATIERRDGVRGPHPAESFRWACSCGAAGRWTRQSDTAETGRQLHVETAGA